MRILMVNNYVTHGGKEQFIEDSRAGLQQAGHVTGLIYTMRSVEVPLGQAGISFCIPGLDSKQALIATMERLRECVALFQPDIIHLYYGPVNLVALRWMLKRFPVMRSVLDSEFLCPIRYYVRADTHSQCDSKCGAICFSAGCLPIVNPRSIFRLLRTKAIQRIYSRGARLSTQSEYLRRHMLQTAGSPTEISVVPVFVPPVAPYSPPLENSRFLFVGRLHPLKGPQIAIQAMSHLPAEATLEVVGMGGMDGQLRELAKSLGLESRVHFRGYISREELEREYLRSTAVVFPAMQPENCPVVIQESLAAGRPVITTAMGGIPELLVDGVEGFILPKAEVSAMAAAMLSILNDPGMAQQMGRNGRRRIAREEYSLGHHVRELHAEYESTIRKFSLRRPDRP